MLAALPLQDALEALRLLEMDGRATLFGYLPPKSQTVLARLMSRRELADVVLAMSHDERADLFKKLDETERKILWRTAGGVQCGRYGLAFNEPSAQRPHA